MSFSFDFRLIEVAMELATLEEHLDMIERQIASGAREAQDSFHAQVKALEPEDEGERQLLRHERDYHIEVVLPRVFRNPFLVSLFSVYETSVTEVARLLQERQGKGIALDDIRGGFLKRAKKYYRDVLQFDLSRDNERWKHLVMLLHLRNVVAHTNGRLDVGNDREKLLQIEGVGDKQDFMVVSESVLREKFAAVQAELEDLVARYKEWDTANQA